jgi:hypothetical protein
LRFPLIYERERDNNKLGIEKDEKMIESFLLPLIEHFCPKIFLARSAVHLNVRSLVTDKDSLLRSIYTGHF